MSNPSFAASTVTPIMGRALAGLSVLVALLALAAAKPQYWYDEQQGYVDPPPDCFEHPSFDRAVYAPHGVPRPDRSVNTVTDALSQLLDKQVELTKNR